jgi:Phage minor capsid protein 2
VDGDKREDAAASVGAAVAAIYATAELLILSALSDAVRIALPIGAATVRGMNRLRQEVAGILAAAEIRVRKVVESAGVPWDYQPLIPAPQPVAPEPVTLPFGQEPPHAVTAPVPELEAGQPPEIAPPPPPPAAPPAAPEPEPEPEPATPADLPPAPDLAGATGQATAPSIQQMIESVSVRVYREIPDLYQQAVRDAIESTRGGLPGNSLSLSRIQAAQKALGTLTGHGITGFTDRAGRNWDLLAYVEMATRTAVSNAYDNLQNAALIRGGHDLIYTLTHSTEGSCPLCIPWLGKVLSLTGATTGDAEITDAAGLRVRLHVDGTLGEARAAGFRHPNCRCSWIPFVNGADLAAASMFAEPPDMAEETYRASQVQRALERRVRRDGHRAATAMNPAERAAAERDLAAARRASAEHRARTGLRMTKAGWRRREHPFDAH